MIKENTLYDRVPQPDGQQPVRAMDTPWHKYASYCPKLNSLDT